MMTETAQEKRELLEAARTALLRLCPEGSEVTCVLKAVSQSGMSRKIILLVPEEYTTGKGEKRIQITNISSAAARVLGERYDADAGAVRVTGCGMDMGFHLVDSLGGVLYGGNYKLKHRWV